MATNKKKHNCKKKRQEKKKKRDNLEQTFFLILFKSDKVEADRFVRLRDCFRPYFSQIYARYYSKYSDENSENVVADTMVKIEPALLKQSQTFAKLVKPLFQDSTTSEIATNAFCDYYRSYFTEKAKEDSDMINID